MQETNKIELAAQKKSLVVVSNGITPYGLHFLMRLAEELTEFKLRTIYTYEFSMGKWPITLPASINAVVLGKDELAESLTRGILVLWKGLSRTRQLIKEIKKQSPSIVMILTYDSPPHFFALEWCRWSGIPCMLMADSNILGDKNKGLKASFKKFVVSRIVSRCSALLPCASLGGRYFQKYGARKEQIFFVPNEPDYSLIENASPEIIKSLTSEFKLDSSRHRFLFSGRFIPVKRIDLLIKAFIQISEKLPNWDLLVAGNGPLESELKALVPDHLRQRIIWTGYFSSTERISALYRLADVLVLPSEYEAWALVVNEAACAGLALICSDVVGAVPELLHDGENGRIFESGNLTSLINAMIDVAGEQNLIKYKTTSKKILDNWRQTNDPVNGFRRALDYCLKRN